MGAAQRDDSHPTREQLRDFNLGRLSDEAAVALGEHLELCAACCQALREQPDDLFLAQLKGTAVPEPLDRAALPQLTDYQIVRELGRGGMGVVYEAEQLSLKRRVAVKVLPARLNEGAALERFRRESRLAARLHHTNVVPVFEVGHEGDAWFYVMQLITGRSLDRVIAQLRAVARANPQTGTWTSQPDTGIDESNVGSMDSTRVPESPAEAFEPVVSTSLPRVLPTPLPVLSPQEVARIGLQVAEALAHAHDRGVLHRDIKPSNLLLDDRGMVWVTDFGLAKAENDDLTGTGAVVGTLRYMAPERFGGECDARADVYALGCTLYELLALRPAFDAAGTAEAVRQVLESVPPRLHALNPSVPRDLETIVHKAMDRDRGRRYQSAQELADDLRRFLNGQPTRARPPGPVERLARLARRNRGLAAALVMITILVLAGLAGLGVATAEFREQAVVQRKLAGEAEVERAKAEIERAKAVQANEEAGRALRRAETTLTDLYASHGLAAAERGNAPRAMLWFANAARLAARDPDRARINGTRARTWGRQTTLPVRAFGHDGANLRSMSFRPGAGDLLLTVTEWRRYRVWDWAREEPLPWADGGQAVLAACWSPDGRWLALGFERVVEVREVPSGEVVHRIPRKAGAAALAFSPDGRFLATSGGGLDIYDCSKKELTGPAWVPPSSIRALTFGPRGDRLAVLLAGGVGRVRLFAVTAGRRSDAPLYEPPGGDANETRGEPPEGAGEPTPPVFIADGRVLVALGGGKKLVCWDAGTGRPVGDAPRATGVDQLNVLAAAPDGRTFAAGGSGGVHGPEIWSASTAGLTGAVAEHGNHVAALAFSPNGRELLSASWDRTARLWSVPDGRSLGHPLPHQDAVYKAAYAPDGSHLATAQRGGLVRVWRRPVSDPDDRTVPLYHNALGLKPGRGSRFVIPGKFGGEYYPGTGTGAVFVIDTAVGAPVGPAFSVGREYADAAVAGDGRTAAVAVGRGGPNALHLWDTPTGRPVCDPIPLSDIPGAVAFTADDARVGVVCDGGEVLLFDARTGREVLRFRLDGWRPGAHQRLGLVAVPPQPGSAGGALAVAHAGSSVRICDEATGAALSLPAPAGGVSSGIMRLAPDGRRLAVAWCGRAHAVQVFDPHTGAPLSEPLPHPDSVFDVCFTPDSTGVFTGCRDGQARLWDLKTARQVCPPCTHPDEVYGVAVTPDGRWGLTACRKGNQGATGSVHYWELTTGKPAAPAVHFKEGSARGVAVSPDGARAVVSVERVGLRVLSLTDLSAPDELGPDDLCTLAELAAGHRLYEGDVAGLGGGEWLALWRAFRQRHPTYGAPPFAAQPRGPALMPSDYRALWVLADAHASKRAWKRAADTLGRATLPAQEGWHQQWCYLGVLLAETGDREAYRRHCRAMLEHFGDTQKPEIAERVAKIWLLLPGELEPEPGTRLSDRALELGAESEYVMWFHGVKGMAEYRQGRFKSAIEQLERSRKLNAAKFVHLEALDLLFLAMACKRSGDDEADRRFAQARKYIDERLPKPGANLRGVWPDQLLVEIVGREAEALFRARK